MYDPIGDQAIKKAKEVKTTKNRVFAGRAVSRGVGVGTVLCLFGANRQFFKSRIEPQATGSEIRRFRKALKTAEEQLNRIVSAEDAGEGQSGIFETHLLFLKDRSLILKIESMIAEQRVNCEWAVSSVIDEYAAKYKKLSDKHLREKHIDLEDVGNRLIAALGGERETGLEVDGHAVVVAREINPSTLIEIASAQPAALVTQNGGWTSHTFILARELGIPAVTGISELLRRTETGERMIVDGFRGEIVVDPSDELINQYRMPESIGVPNVEVDEPATPQVRTIDGEEIRLCVNLDLALDAAEIERVSDFGVGLYRSEYLFKRFAGYPLENEQYEKYLEVLELARDSPVIIRTFDLGPGEIVGGGTAREKNPALGMRGIRLSLRDELQFRIQIRALLRAGVKKNLDIVFPLVSDISELRQTKEIVSEEQAKLKSEGQHTSHPRLGAMIEVPAAVMMIDEIFAITEFVNVGTNDLVQYLLAVDRDNDNLANYFRTLHPAVIRSLKLIFESAARHGKEAVMCGEMAGSPLYVPLLIGLGARTLSMNPASLDRIASIVRQISAQEAIDIAEKVAGTETWDEAERQLKELYRGTWPHIVQLSNFISSRE
ncbi:MAG: phosphoenolpyruvate--protein phosphotransferase [Acidobacteriota bacterium]|nr:phosphoenolpyruvate--protein phosphotransferase [Acidobacteriota bacterium]